MPKQAVSIIGAGALGGTLAQALHEVGISIKGIYNRHPGAAFELAEQTGAPHAGDFPHTKAELGSLVFLTVADQAIEETAQKLAALAEDFSAFTVVHCSGTKTSACLQTIRQKGAATASFHPLQTFTRTSTPAEFDGIYIDLEGNKSAIPILKQRCDDLNATPITVKMAAKPYLHTAAVMTSNYLIALMESASQIAAMGDIDEKQARAALAPLAKQSLDNISGQDDLYAVLSGPIVRGDTATIAEHLMLLKQNPQLLNLYQDLGKVLLEGLQKREGDGAESKKMEELAALLDDRS